MSYQEKLNAEFGRSKSVEEEKQLLREQIVDLRKVDTQNHVIYYINLFFIIDMEALLNKFLVYICN